MEREDLVTRVPKRKGRTFTEVIMTAKGRELHRLQTKMEGRIARRTGLNL